MLKILSSSSRCSRKNSTTSLMCSAGVLSKNLPISPISMAAPLRAAGVEVLSGPRAPTYRLALERDTPLQVVVHEATRLHCRVHGRGSHEHESRLLELLGQGGRLGRGRGYV